MWINFYMDLRLLINFFYFLLTFIYKISIISLYNSNVSSLLRSFDNSDYLINLIMKLFFKNIFSSALFINGCNVFIILPLKKVLPLISPLFLFL